MGDLLVCTVAIINCIYVLIEDDVNPDIVQAIDSFFSASYWATMVSRNMNMKRCIHLMIVSWIIFAFIAVFFLSFIALVKIYFLRLWSRSTIETYLVTNELILDMDLKHTLGEGEFGTVYAGKYVLTELHNKKLPVAIKVINKRKETHTSIEKKVCENFWVMGIDWKDRQIVV
uniref:Protein kinase domain-containing protein n=1 Tax=Acrobeloides nanus TaxID=290746 RepID=A0A914EET7_9BILA